MDHRISWLSAEGARAAQRCACWCSGHSATSACPCTWAQLSDDQAVETVTVVQKLQRRTGAGHSQWAWASVMSTACSCSHQQRRHLLSYTTWVVLAHSVVVVAADGLVPACLPSGRLSLSLRVSLGLNMSLSLSLRSRLRDVVHRSSWYLRLYSYIGIRILTSLQCLVVSHLSHLSRRRKAIWNGRC